MSRTRSFLLTLLVVFGVMTLGGAGGTFWWWGVGFDEAEAFGVATASTDAAMLTSAAVATMGLAGLLVISAVVAMRRGRNRS